MSTSAFSRTIFVISTLIALVLSSIFTPATRAFPVLASTPSIHPGFPISLNGAIVRSGSVALGDLNGDGVSDIVVGASDGKVYAYTGAGVRLWEYDTGNMAIESKPAIADLDGDGKNEVVVSAGSTFTSQNSGAGVYILNPSGALRCAFTATGDFNGDNIHDGIFSSPAVADIDGDKQLEIVFGGYDGWVRIMNNTCTIMKERFVRDTIWSSPAIADINRDGKPEIIIGVDAHIEPGFGTLDGGILHVYDGNLVDIAGFPKQIDEVIYSSPVIGDINGDGNPDIVVGTGRCYNNVPDCASGGRVHPGVGEYINAWDAHGNLLPGWPHAIPGQFAFASPALANMDSDPELEVIINTAEVSQDLTKQPDGWMHVLDGNGAELVGWPKKPIIPATPTSTISWGTNVSPIVVDINGDGNHEIFVPCNFEIVAWSKNGIQLTRTSFPPQAGQWSLNTEYSVGSSPAVGDIDGDGKLELVVASGRSNYSTGGLYAWDFEGNATPAALPWPSFRRSANNNAQFVTSSLKAITQIALMVEPNQRNSMALPLVDTAGGAITWAARPDQTWMTVSPSSGTTPSTLTIVVDAAGKDIGNYDGTISISSSSGNLTVPVRMVVVAELSKTYIPLLAR